MKKALEAAGRMPEWMSVPGEAHGFYKDENNAAFYKRLEAFLARNIGAGEHCRSLPQTRQPGVADSNVNPGQMRTFVPRQRGAPTDSRKPLASAGRAPRTKHR